MLLPDARGRASYHELAGRISAVTGGVPDAEPHVTVAYFQGYADKAHTARRLGQLWVPSQIIRARGLFSFGDEPHPLFGYTLLMRVVKDESLRRLHDRIRRAVGQRGLVLARPWDDVDVHLRLLQHLPVPPSQALARLGTNDVSLEFAADALLVTQMVDQGFEEWLRRPLGSPLRSPMPGLPA
jgi:2'-5' RNA ligase